MNDNVTFTKCPCCGGQITTIECERSGNQVVISGDKVVSKFLWISCSDRMPQLYQRVLVCIENETVTVGYLCGNEWCITEKGCMYKYRYKDFNITHWMQLPEQPEGGEQNAAD